MPNLRHPAILLFAAALLWLGGCASNRPAEEAFDPESLGVTDRVRHYQVEIRRNPEDPDLHYRLGNALLDMGRYQDAYRPTRGHPAQAGPCRRLREPGARAPAHGPAQGGAGTYVRALELNPGDRTT